jgi:hypothetical protein
VSLNPGMRKRTLRDSIPGCDTDIQDDAEDWNHMVLGDPRNQPNLDQLNQAIGDSEAGTRALDLAAQQSKGPKNYRVGGE